MSAALLVIDVQRGLCEGEGRAWEAERVIERIHTMTIRARAADVPVIFIQHESGPGYLEHGTSAWQLADGLSAEASDLFVRKTTPDSFNNTGLHELLQRHGVDTLVICGMLTEFCVDTTARRALALGYPLTLIAGAHTSAGNAALSPQQVIAHHNLTLADISSFGPRVSAVPSTDVHF